MIGFCCKRFEQELKNGNIEQDRDNEEMLTGKYASTCCCGPGYAHICKDIQFCPWCGARIGNNQPQ